MEKLERMRVSLQVDLLGYGAEVLVPRRKKLGLTQRQMAALCGVNQSKISRLEEGLHPPRDYTSVQVFAENYGLDDDEKARWLALLFGPEARSEAVAIDEVLLPDMEWKDTFLSRELKRHFQIPVASISLRDGRSFSHIASDISSRLGSARSEPTLDDGASEMAHLASVISGNTLVPRDELKVYGQVLNLSVDERVNLKLAAAKDILHTDSQSMYTRAAAAVVATHTDWHLTFLDDEERKALDDRVTRLWGSSSGLAGGPGARLLKDGM